MEKLLTLSEVAELLRISKSYASHVWVEWVRDGVIPIRLSGRSRLLFKASEIERLIDLKTIK